MGDLKELTLQRTLGFEEAFFGLDLDIGGQKKMLPL